MDITEVVKFGKELGLEGQSLLEKKERENIEREEKKEREKQEREDRLERERIERDDKKEREKYERDKRAHERDTAIKAGK